jgi:hypothetical protein
VVDNEEKAKTFLNLFFPKMADVEEPEHPVLLQEEI